MKIVELKCPSCGGKLKIDEKNPNIAICEYCSLQHAIEWDRDQAYFDRRINYQVPKAPVTTKRTGWEFDGWKRRVLVAAVFIGFIFLLCVVKFFEKGSGTQKENEETAQSISVEESMKEIVQANIERASQLPEEVKEVKLTGILGEMASQIFGLPPEEITEEQLSTIKWIETKYESEYHWVGYSFDDPGKEDAELTWIAFSRELDLGQQCLSLFQGLKKINLNNIIKKDYIEGLQLESIGGYFDDPAELAEMLDDPSLIKELQFNSGVTDLEGLEKFSNLETLYIANSELTNIDQLKELPRLKKLVLEGFDSLSDFSVLSSMDQLEQLSLGSERLKILDFVKEMKNLKCLTITSGSMLSLNGIEESVELAELSISGCESLKEADAVTKLSDLRQLSLEIPYGCAEPDLGGLGNLESLTLSGFEDCTFLGSLSQLKVLILDNCTLSDNLDLSHLTELRELSYCTFATTERNISFITRLPALEKLDLQGICTYQDISGIMNMPNLKELNISGMKCEIDFNRIKDNQMLESLSMNGMILYNNVQVGGDEFFTYADWDDVTLSEHTGFLSHFKNLKNLSIAENELTDIEFVRELAMLETIDFSDNYVTDLSPLSEISGLKQVVCTGNPISDEGVLDNKVILIMEY